MSRVSTYGNYQTSLLDMLSAQQRASDAQNRITSGKISTNLGGFGRDAATVTALKTTQTRTDAYIAVTKTVADRLSTQDLAMGRIADASTNARLAVANAIAAGRMDGLMEELKIQFTIASDALNTKHQGQYLFSGGVMDQAPSPINKLDQLDALGAAGDAFQNGQLRQASRLDENVVMDTGFLAAELGSELFGVFKDLQALHQTNPIEGKIDGPMNDALTAIMVRFEKAASNLVNEQARNGLYQARVDAVLVSHEARAVSIETMLGDKTDADMAKAVTDLELAQVALQASAQVISQLRQVSLLDYLR